MKILKKLLKLLDGKQKLHIAGLVFLMFIGAFLEACSVAVLIPVISVVFQPGIITTNKYLSILYNYSPFNSEKAFGVAIMVGLVLVCGNDSRSKNHADYGD